jgi:hypothetical protein
MNRKTAFVSISALPFFAAPAIALAQDAPADPGQGGPSVTVVQAPPTQTVTTNTPYGFPGKDFDPNSHLGQGSKPLNDINGGSGFDFKPGSHASPGIRGGANGSYIVEGQFVPEAHSVRRGDTLWDISGKYFGNGYQWPRIWAYNPQVQNPHWIYPGDRVRLRDPSLPEGSGDGIRRHTGVVPHTIFLRDVGWIDDRKEDTWGEVIASPDDQMLLSEGDDVYIQLDDDKNVSIGEELTIFNGLRTIDSDDAKGELVSIRGTARVDRYNPKTHTVKAKIIESLDVIERGAKIGPVGRRFDVVPPTVAEQDVEAAIVATIYPSQIIGDNQVIFLDKGEKDGLKPGVRLFGLRRGDRWINDIKRAGALARQRPKVHDDKPARIEGMVTSVDDDSLPDESYAEVRVLRVRDHSATALVTHSQHEIDKTAHLYAKKDY